METMGGGRLARDAFGDGDLTLPSPNFNHEE